MSALSLLGIGAFGFLCVAFGYTLARRRDVEWQWRCTRAFIAGRKSERDDQRKWRLLK